MKNNKKSERMRERVVELRTDDVDDHDGVRLQLEGAEVALDWVLNESNRLENIITELEDGR